MHTRLISFNAHSLSQLFTVPRNRRIILFASVTFIALVMRLLTFQQFLPYLETRLEGNAFLLALDWRGLDTDTIYGVSVEQTGDWLAGYPPLYIWQVIGVQQIFDSVANRPWMLISDYIYILRLLAVVYGTLTTLLIAATADEISGQIGAVLSGLVWALSPIILQNNSLATSDPLGYLFVAASLYMTIRAWKTTRPVWILGSLLMGLLAIYAKYPTFPVLIPWGLVLIYLLWVHGRRMLPWLIVQGVISVSAALYLLYGHGASSLSNGETDTFREQGIQLMLNLDRNLNNAGYELLPLSAGLFFVTLILAALACVYSRRQQAKTIDVVSVGLLLLFSVGGVLVVSGFFYLQDTSEIRHVLPISIALIIVWGTSANQIIESVIYWLRQRMPDRPLMSRLVPIGAVGIVLASLMVGAVEVIRHYHLPHTIPWLWRWANINLPNEGTLMMSDDHLKTRESWGNLWNRPYSGYDGQQYFNWVFINDVDDESAEDLFEKGITYLLMTSDDHSYQKPAMQRFISGLMPVKTIPDTPIETAGPQLSIYRLMPPQHAVDVVFGDQIELLGYDLAPDNLSAGEMVLFRPYWRTQQPPMANYSMFIHLYPADVDEVLAQYDGAPSHADRLTLTWQDDNETYIGEPVSFPLPDDLAPGDYRLVVGLYNFETGERLPVSDGQTYAVIPLTLVSAP